MRVAQFAFAAFASYVLFRAGAVFAGAVGAAVAAVAVVAVSWKWRRSRPIALGLLIGAAVSAFALAV